MKLNKRLKKIGIIALTAIMLFAALPFDTLFAAYAPEVYGDDAVNGVEESIETDMEEIFLHNDSEVERESSANVDVEADVENDQSNDNMQNAPPVDRDLEGEGEDYEDIQPLSGANNLSLRVGGVEGFGDVTVDVDDLTTPNHITWPRTIERRTIEIHAEFDNVGADQERRIVVEIPEGYRILEYTARSGTAVGGGVTELFLSAQDDSKITSSVLTASDGTAWIDQGIDGHTAWGTSNPVTHRTHHGRIEYTFNSNMDSITLTVILGVDAHIMSRGSTSLQLDPITVSMINGVENLESHFYSTITQLNQANLVGASQVGGTHSRNISFNPTTGYTGMFRTGHRLNMLTTFGNALHLVESKTVTISYPEGVTFVGFQEIVTGIHQPTSTSFSNDHLTVSHDPVTRQVTFIYSNVRINNSYPHTFVLYWTAEVDGVVLTPNVAHPFTGNILVEYQDGSSREDNHTINITFREPVYDIRLIPDGLTLRDLNEHGDFPYSYRLGGFTVDTSQGSVTTPDLFYRMTFPDELFIRAIRTPRRLHNTINTNVTAIAVSSTTGVERTITVPGPFTNGVNSTQLGLAPDEFLREISANLTPLEVGIHGTDYVDGRAFAYFGRFQNGETGGVELRIYTVGDEDNTFVTSAIDQPVINWTNTGAGSVMTQVRHADGGQRAFFPNDRMHFTSTYLADAQQLRGGQQHNDIVDPRIIISLPEGINLDLTSVSVLSTAGNHGNASFIPTLISVDTQVIDGLTWTTHIFESPNRHDMIAMANNQIGAAESPFAPIIVNFEANVSASTQAFPELRAQDLVLWDLGASAINRRSSGFNFVVTDTHNRAGNGTSYNLVGGGNSPEVQVVLAPGFWVNLGIREAGSDVPFFTYDGTEASIAPIAIGGNVEIYLSFLNNDSTSLFPGTEIYLPIPRAGVNYTRYFNNVELSNPAGVLNNEPTLWTGILTEEISLSGFTTYYRVATSNVNPIPGGGITNSWVPVEGPWMTYAELIANGYTLADVSMVRFIAYEAIGPFATGSTTFEMGIGDDANIGDTNFWRTYQKGWRSAAGAGTWTHGAVIAAEPAGGGISGMLFTDLNRNGIMDSGEAFRNRVDATDDESAPIVTALLVGDNGTIINLRMNPDGSFSALNDDDTINLLRVGNYTVTLTNHDPANWRFTPITPESRSSTTSWHMDIAQANIAANHQTATFTFSIAPGDAANVQLLGVGLIPRLTITLDTNGGAFPAEEGEDPDLIRTEDVFMGDLIPIPELPEREGYTFMGWYEDPTDLDTRWNFITGRVEEEKTLYARWERILLPFNITYEFTGDIPPSATAPSSRSVIEETENQSATSVTPTTVPGLLNGVQGNFVFQGWESEEVSNPDSFTMPDEDVHFVGEWIFTADTFDITYGFEGEYPSGASVPTARLDVVAGTPGLSATELTPDFMKGYREGVIGTWIFNGWESDEVTNPSDFMMPNEDVHFVGTWSFNPDSFDVTYEFEGETPEGITAPSSRTVTAGLTNQSATTVTSPIEGYRNGILGTWTFNGWTSEEVVDATNFTMPNEDVHFVGSWTFTANAFVISYEFEGDAPVGVTPPVDRTGVLAGTEDLSATDLTVTTFPGTHNGVDGTWTFNGWTSEDVSDVDDFAMPNGNVRMVGSWTFEADPEPTDPSTTTPEETTAPATTVPEETTVPTTDPSEPVTTTPEETTVPTTTDPSEPVTTTPEETTVPTTTVPTTDPSEPVTTTPEETTAPATTVPIETTVPVETTAPTEPEPLAPGITKNVCEIDASTASFWRYLVGLADCTVPGPVVVGEYVEYVLTVSNPNDFNFYNFLVIDNLANGDLEGVRNIRVLPNVGYTVQEQVEELRILLDYLPANGSVTIRFEARVADNVEPGYLINTAYLYDYAPETSERESVDRDTEAIVVEEDPEPTDPTQPTETDPVTTDPSEPITNPEETTVPGETTTPSEPETTNPEETQPATTDPVQPTETNPEPTETEPVETTTPTTTEPADTEPLTTVPEETTVPNETNPFVCEGYIIVSVDRDGNVTVTAPPGIDYEVIVGDDGRIHIHLPPEADGCDVTINLPDDEWDYEIDPDDDGRIVTVIPPGREEDCYLVEDDEEGNGSGTGNGRPGNGSNLPQTGIVVGSSLLGGIGLSIVGLTLAKKKKEN